MLFDQTKREIRTITDKIIEIYNGLETDMLNSFVMSNSVDQDIENRFETFKSKLTDLINILNQMKIIENYQQLEKGYANAQTMTESRRKLSLQDIQNAINIINRVIATNNYSELKNQIQLVKGMEDVINRIRNFFGIHNWKLGTVGSLEDMLSSGGGSISHKKYKSRRRRLKKKKRRIKKTKKSKKMKKSKKRYKKHK